MFDKRDPDELVARADAAHERVGRSSRELLSVIAELDRCEIWREWGARDTAHWVSMRYGISAWKAHRWIAASHALKGLPGLSGALSGGELGIDKVVELARFATEETEAGLIRWAKQVSCAAIRRKADLEVSSSREQEEEAEKARFATWWWFDENRRFGLQAELPAAQGAVVARALERLAESLPVMPGEQEPYFADARRADALVALCSARIASDPDPDRATVIVHADLQGLEQGTGGAEIEGATVIHPETARRLLCNARVQMVVEDRAGNVLGLGRTSREPSAAMMRQIRYRDRECRFPGCGTRAFTQAHHITWWRHGGRTDLDNLLLICSFHHRLVHELGWRVKRDPDGTVRWFRPDGIGYRAGPSPGAEANDQNILTAVG